MQLEVRSALRPNREHEGEIQASGPLVEIQQRQPCCVRLGGKRLQSSEDIIVVEGNPACAVGYRHASGQLFDVIPPAVERVMPFLQREWQLPAYSVEKLCS
ncbi:hypothetical protein [Pseudoxanthomonas mexicana]